MECLHISIERTDASDSESSALLIFNFRYDPLDAERVVKLRASPANVDSWRANAWSDNESFNERFRKLFDKQDVHVAIVERDVVDCEGLLTARFNDASKMYSLQTTDRLIVINASKDSFREIRCSLSSNWRAILFSARTSAMEGAFAALCKGERPPFVEEISTSVSIKFQFYY